MTVAPEATPTKKPKSMLTNAPVEPTAASASFPAKRPTIIASTVLYICWKNEPSRMGKKNSKSCFQMTPSVMPFTAVRFWGMGSFTPLVYLA